MYQPTAVMIDMRLKISKAGFVSGFSRVSMSLVDFNFDTNLQLSAGLDDSEARLPPKHACPALNGAGMSP